MTTPGEIKTDEPALVYTLRNLLAADRIMDALGAFYLTTSCDDTAHPREGHGWSIITVDGGPQLHLCGTCGKPTNKTDLLPPAPYVKGDVVFWCELLWEIAGAPGPTGAVTLRPLDSDELVGGHVLQLNQED